MTQADFELRLDTGGLDLHVQPEALGSYLTAHVQGFAHLKGIERLGGGQSNPTYRLLAASGRYVLRRKPYGELLPSAHAIDREFRVMKALANSPVPVPEVFHYCADSMVLGSPFYVMQHVDGEVHWDGRLPQCTPEVRRCIYDEMSRVLAALHELDPDTLGLADFGRSGGYFERQIRRWTAQYRAAETGPRDDVERLIEWLPEHLPEDDGQFAVTHGDFRLDNFVFSPEGKALALLDWELSTLGHPYADLAYQCAQWRLPPGELRGLAGVDRGSIQLPAEAEYVARYLARRRRVGPIREWTFCLALSLFRLVSICQGVYRRGLDGNASSERALEYGPRVDLIARAAVEIVSPS